MRCNFTSSNGRSRGFTLVELLVVSVIILALAVLALIGTRRFIENGRKVKTLAMFRDFKAGMAMYEGDYGRPPIPENKRSTGWDTIYGDPGGQISNQFLISVLAGDDETIPYVSNVTFSSSDTNPRGETYITFPLSIEKKSGVGEDGRLYDPWGREIIVAVNSLNAPGQLLRDFNNGQNDRRLHTWGLGEYTETKPRDESYVFWSYGKNGIKGQNGQSVVDVVPLAGSDDVISW
ncbi:MAG: type II secretion system protein [Luteolibacter sp.]